MTEHDTTGGDPAAENPDDDSPAETRTSRGRQACADLPLTARIEALLISAERPLGEARISALLALPGKGTAGQVRKAIEELNDAYEEAGRSFRIERLAGGWQILTRPEFGELLARLHADRQQSRLSQAALETLAIIAYRQPIMRAEVEAIRGVACGEVLRGLLDRRLVKVVGRAEELGRPMLYGTTKEFLKVFGLSGTDDLPAVEGAEPRPKNPPPPPEGARGTESPSDEAESAESSQAVDNPGLAPEEAQSPGAESADAAADDADSADSVASRIV